MSIRKLSGFLRSQIAECRGALGWGLLLCQVAPRSGIETLAPVGRAMQPSATYTPNGAELALGVVEVEGNSYVVFSCEGGLRVQRFEDTAAVSFLGES